VAADAGPLTARMASLLQFVNILIVISTPTDPVVRTVSKAEYAGDVYCLHIMLFYSN
jgi:hypothetical protein